MPIDSSRVPVTDKYPFASNLVTDSQQLGDSDQFYETLGNHLTGVDLERFKFLLSDLLRDQDLRFYDEKFENDRLTTGFKLRQIITAAIEGYHHDNRNQNRRHVTSDNLCQELFYITKKYKLLKKYFHHCKHKVELTSGQNWMISTFRRFLFDLCEELTSQDVAYISTHFQVTAPTAESLFQFLWSVDTISVQNVERLRTVFRTMERNDLILIVNQYLQKTRYYDLGPTLEHGQYCGKAVIINQYQFNKPAPPGSNPASLTVREGTYEDEENLNKLWRSYGLIVDRHRDLTSFQIESKLKDYAISANNKEFKIFICCILSHGEEDFVFGSDGLKVRLQDIYAIFGENSSRFLDGKPKLFFVQACQGSRRQFGPDDSYPPRQPQCESQTQNDLKCDAPTAGSVPMYSDILIGISSVPGFVSFREEGTGSWYIQTLVEILTESGHREDLNSLMTTVNERMARRTFGKQKQMCTVTNQLRLKLVFNKI